MSADPHASAIAIAAAAHRARAAKESAHSAALAKEREEARLLRDDEAKRARIIELEDQDAAIRHLDGVEAVAAKPQRAKALAALNDKIPRRKAALPVLKKRAAEAGQEAANAELPVNAAVMAAVAMIQAPAAERVRAILAELEAPLCDMLTADLIRLGTIGERFAVPAGQEPPFNGGIVVRKLLAAISPRLLPSTLKIDRLEAQARAAATVAVCDIKENRK